MKNGRRFLNSAFTVALLYLFVLAALTLLLAALTAYPIQTLIIVGIAAFSVLAVVLYIWELVAIGWIMDFLERIGMPRIQAVSVPLEYEEVGQIVVVGLRNNIGSVLDCQSVEKQLLQLIDEGRCDFIFDFRHAGKVSRHFHAVMLHVMKAAGASGEAWQALPTGRAARGGGVQGVRRPVASAGRNDEARRPRLGCRVLGSLRDPRGLGRAVSCRPPAIAWSADWRRRG